MAVNGDNTQKALWLCWGAFLHRLRNPSHSINAFLVICKFLKRYILGAVQDANNYDPIIIRPEIDTPLSIRKTSQAIGNMVTRRARKIDVCNPFKLGMNISHEVRGNFYAFFRDIEKYLG